MVGLTSKLHSLPSGVYVGFPSDLLAKHSHPDPHKLSLPFALQSHTSKIGPSFVSQCTRGENHPASMHAVEQLHELQGTHMLYRWIGAMNL